MPDTRVNTSAAAALAEAKERYAARHRESASLHEAACRSLPGGNTRSVLFFDPFPVMFARGAGCRLWDVDGNEYIDFLGEYTAGLYGHSHPVIQERLRRVLDDGLNFGGHTALEGKLASLVCARFPSIELVRFTNSGTEANLMALTAARAATKREAILVFEGAYHGGVLNFGAGIAAINVPFPIVTAPYNDLAATRRTVEAEKDRLAAIILEPMQGGAGCIPAELDFLRGLRELASRHGIVLIFDEVMTSRLAPGGLQEATGVIPDMTTLGKYIGGGMSFGAFGGKEAIMSLFDPRKPNFLPHAGTFNNNVMTMAAGLAGLSEVYTPAAAKALNEMGETLRSRLNDIAQKHEANVQFTGRGSMMNIHFTRHPIRRKADVKHVDPDLAGLFFFDLLERGLYVARRGMLNLSLPIGKTETDALAAAFEEFVTVRGNLLR
ncbi:MAG TPA: aspartate aminotransferase family protein [Stellaceae bacterium]|nr:aspartate aminotransferase family protein [Stellaceae bacterium]